MEELRAASHEARDDRGARDYTAGQAHDGRSGRARHTMKQVRFHIAHDGDLHGLSRSGDRERIDSQDRSIQGKDCWNFKHQPPCTMFRRPGANTGTVTPPSKMAPAFAPELARSIQDQIDIITQRIDMLNEAGRKLRRFRALRRPCQSMCMN